MNKQSFITFLLTVLMSMTGAKAFAHDIEVANADGVTIYYNYKANEEKTELSVSYYRSYNGYSGNVVIPSSVVYNGNTYSVTSIGDYAFRECDGLTSVTIPNSVTSIGEYAFYRCNVLASVTIPNSVTYIGESAFSGCSGLTSITIPNSVTSIGYRVFYCSGLTSVTIPSSVTFIGSDAFSGCSSLTSVTIPNSVTFIGSDAFSGCSSLTSVTIPNSVTSIGESAFSGCSGLTSITIPNSVTSIGNSAFWNCSRLTSVHITDLAAWCNIKFYNGSSNPLGYADHLYIDGKETTNLQIPNSVTSIGDWAFYGCSGLTSVTIPNSVTSIGDWAFDGCSGLTSVTIPNSVTSIGYEAFSGCSGLTSVTIGNSVTSIGDQAFWNCSSLTTATIPNSVKSIGSNAFSYCSSLRSVTISNSVTSIGNSVFEYCNSLTTIVSEIKTPFEIGSIVSTIVTLVVPVGTKVAYQSTEGWSSFANTVEVGEGGFAGWKFEINGICYTIGENNTASPTSASKAISGALVIPSQVELNGKKYDVTSIGKSAFSGCSALTSVVIPNSVTSIGNSAFSDCSGLTSFTIPNSVTSIGEGAFNWCSGLTSVIIGSGVTSIGNNAFFKTNLKKTIWLTNTPPSGYSNAAGAVNYVSNDQFSLNNQVKYQFLSSYFDVDGIRYVPVSPSERTCDAIDCVYNESAANTKIGPSVTFKGVTMTVKNIQPYIAYGNKYIETLDVDNDGAISEHAFNGCLNMKSAKIGTKVSAFGQYAFSGCSSLEAIDIPEIIEVLNENTFSRCSSLAEIVIKPKMTIINDNVFLSCTSLKKVIIADSDNELKLGTNDYSGTPLFSDCPLDSVYIGRNIGYKTTKQYGYSPFYRNTSLRAVKITDKETEISANEFYGCSNLQRVIIGDGVTTIGNWAFSGCQSLKFFAFGSQVATIGQEAFSDCAAVIEISSKAKTAPECGAQALDDISKWECKLYVPDGYMAAYEAADQWKDFFFKEEGEGTAGQGAGSHPDDNKKCETPTITVDGSTIKFDCKTSGVMFHYNISSADAKSDVANSSIEVKNSYTVTVYASKEGYVDSEVARASFQVAGASKKGDVNGDNKVDVADHVELSKIIMNQ